MVAPRHQIHGAQAAVHHQHGSRFVAGMGDRFVQQRLVGHDLTAARSGIGTHDHSGLSIFNP